MKDILKYMIDTNIAINKSRLQSV